MAILPPRYALIETLHEGKARVVQRVDDARSGHRVLLKRLRTETADAQDLRRIRHERDMLGLVDDAGVTRVLDYEEQGLDAWLVLEDIGGESVAQRMARGRLPLLEAIQIGAAVARSLGAIHAKHIVHKDIGPNNVAVGPLGRVQVFDFDLAAHLPRGAAGIPPSDHVEGTLAYLSPEQTGRMSLAVDERSDLYSLGAMLHEMLTGRPPFTGHDALEIVHAHMALRPAPPHTLDPNVPEVVSAIVLKLLEKAPEDRYQSAFGVEHDLLRCAADLAAGGGAPFPIGMRDVPARLHLTRRIHGREAEVAQLVAAFAACREGRSPITIVVGPPGIGKSTVVRALARHVATEPAFFGAGKLEADRPEAPYAAFVGPLRALAQQVFASGEAEIDALRSRVALALGGAGRPLADLVPELSFLVGEPRGEDSGAMPLSRDQARMLFTDLLRGLASPERPVVLAIDDVQWADAASVDLLGALARQTEIRGLCVVVTARDEALEAGHPVAALLGALRDEGSTPHVITLSTLTPSALAGMLAGMLALPADEADALASLILPKTHGNAFSTGVFLSAIHGDGLLSFDRTAGRWTWNADAITALPVADNVVAWLAERTAGLDDRVRRTLGVSACLGGRVDVAQIAAVGRMTESDAEAALGEAAREGLLVPFEGGFRFAHDRVLEASYRAVSAADLRAFHGAAARRLRGEIERPEIDPAVFDVLRHATAAGEDAFDTEERLDLARLGLVAGRRARASAAFEAAQLHLATAIARLPEGAWRRAHGLAYDLHFAAVECAYAAARFEEGDRLFPSLVEHAASDEIRAYAWAMRALGGVGSRRFTEALAHVRTGAALVGLRLPAKGTLPGILYELAKTSRAVHGRSAAELSALPRLTNPRAEAALHVIGAGLGAAYLSDRNMFVLMALRGAALVAEHGNCAAASNLYSLYALVVGAVLRDHERMKELGQLAFTIHEAFPDPLDGCRTFMTNGVFIQHFRDHVRTALPLLEEAQRMGHAGGETLIPGVCAFFLATLPFFAGNPIEDVLAATDAQLRITARNHAADAQDAMILFRQVLLALRGKTAAPGSLATADFDPERHRRHIEKYGTATSGLSLRFLTGLWHASFERPREALAQFDEIHGAVEREWACMFMLGEYSFQRALALSALIADGSLGRVEREAHVIGLRLAVRKLDGWARRSPRNFEHKHALASAELHALTGDADAALRGYQEAINGAQRGGFVQDVALAAERAGAFFFARGMHDVAVAYVDSARRTYLRWGASAKVARLDQRFPGLEGKDPGAGLAGAPSFRGALWTTRSPSSSGTTTTSGALDGPSIAKAVQALSSERTLGQLFARMMEIVAETAGAQRGALFLVDETGPAARIEMHAEIRAGALPALLPTPRSLDDIDRVPAGIVRWVARAGERVLLADAALEGPFTRDPYVLAQRSRSILALPLLLQGQALGVLLLENDLVPGTFTEARAELLATLCAQLAISIQNARYYAELEGKVDERTRALRDAQSRIIALEKDATEVQMAGGFAHEMRNALAGARMLLQMALGSSRLPDGGLFAQASQQLHDIYVEALPAFEGDRRASLSRSVRALNDLHHELDDVLRRTEEAVTRGLGLTNDVLAYAAMRREERGESPILLRPAVEALARDVSMPGVRFEIDVPAGAAIRCKPDHLRSILENVVRNACEAVVEAAPSGGGVIRVRVTVSPPELTIDVEDNGVGMSPEVQSHVFEPFFSTKPTSGIGLGLGVVRKLVSLYDGRVAIESEVGRGTRFTIAFPCATAEHEAPRATLQKRSAE